MADSPFAAHPPAMPQLVNSSKSNEQWNAFISNPVIPVKKKIEFLETVLDKAPMDDITKNFLYTCTENKRLAMVDKISAKYAEIMMASRGEVPGTLTTAYEISAQEEKEIKDALKGSPLIEKGQKVNLKYDIDPSIVGGFILTIGDKQVDMSTKKRMTIMSDHLKHFDWSKF